MDHREDVTNTAEVEVPEWVRKRDDIADLVNKENLTVPEWARIVGVKTSYGYEMSRHDRIPGMFRIGKFVRVHMPTFYALSRVGEQTDHNNTH